MNNIYEKPIKHWDSVFSKNAKLITNEKIQNEDLDKALNYLVTGNESIIDFGCGNGTLLIYSALKGTKLHIGIDLSLNAIEQAKKRTKHMTTKTFDFFNQDCSKLHQLGSNSVDCGILFNIIDNINEKDMIVVLREYQRILKDKSKLLIKLNPYLPVDKYDEYNIKIIDGDLVDDGLLLLNKTNKEWEEILSHYFKIDSYQEVLYSEHNMINRLYFLSNKKE